MKHSGYIGVDRNKYGEGKQRYIWYSKYKNLINVECLYIEWMNEWILYLQKAYTCYSDQTYIYTCNTMTKSREQLNTLYIDNNIN